MRFAWLLFVLAMTGCAAITPLPQDARVQAPVASVPKEVAAFSGKWVGSWDSGTLAGTLVVEQIQGRDATLIYSWGTAPTWGINEPGFVRVRGTFGADNVLRATLRNGAKISYAMNPNGKLDGRYELRGITSGVFERADK